MPTGFTRIVVGVADGGQGADACALGVELAALSGAELVLVTVIGRDRATTARDRGQPERVRVAVRAAADQAPIAGRAQVGSRVEVARSVAHGLRAAAIDADADLVVVGASSHGAIRRALGATIADRLLRASPCAVAVAPSGYTAKRARPFSRIAVAYNDTPEARQALRVAHDLAGRASAVLCAFTVVVPSGSSVVVGAAAPATDCPASISLDARSGRQTQVAAVFERQERAARGALAAAVAELEEPVVVEQQILIGPDPVSMIGAAVRTDTGLLVVGSRRYGRARQALSGAGASRLVRHPPCPVVVIPRGAQPNPRPGPFTRRTRRWRVKSEHLQAPAAPSGSGPRPARTAGPR